MGTMFMVRFDILTIFPPFFESPCNTGILKRAQDSGRISINIVDIRKFTATRHNVTDDYPYGGGVGMVMKPEPIFRAIRSVSRGGPKPRTVLMTPQGVKFTQREAERISRYPNITIICGRYEGVDERVVKRAVDEEISIGDYVLSGGEVAALVVIETIMRLIPGVVGKDESVSGDTFSGKYLKYPQYTRPRRYLGMDVPDVLLGGNHKKIDEWRLRESVARTIKRRPDLIEESSLADREKTIVSRHKGKKT